MDDHSHILTAHVCKRSRFYLCLKFDFRWTYT